MTLAPSTADTAATSVDTLLDANNHDFELREFSPIRGAGPADGAMVGHTNTDSRRLSHPNNRMSISQEDQDALVRLASQVSKRRASVHSEKTQQGTLFEIDEDDAALDPSRKEFDLEKWLRRVIHGLKKEGIRMKSSGIVFKNLRVVGTSSALMLQETVGDLLTAPLRVGELLKGFKQEPKTILSDFNGLVRSGEMLLVLGRPGSGCSTFLKSLCGELHGLSLDPNSVIHYDGIPQRQMIKEFKGEVVYNQEVDKHFPHLTVGQTLEFAAAVRTPSRRLQNISRDEYARQMTQVIMAIFGLSHTFNTKVGSDVVRGVSGGERKRVSIAEMVLAGAPIAAWDNSTRGLDSATALKFVESLRLFSDLGGTSNAVAVYQASQAIYDIFDKVVVLYEGRQIYFGPTATAKQYFERQGWHCPPRQTTGDFLTSITNPVERQARPGMEKRVPRTPDEFEALWKQSEEYRQLQKQIAVHEETHPMNGNVATGFQEQKREGQAKHTREGSPYLISIPMQVRLNIGRAYQRTWNDLSSTLTGSVGQAIMALIIGSIFYGTPTATAGFSAKGAVLFFAVLLNALIAITEINSLYSQREIVEKHASYAFYHPATEAIAGVVSDIPVKFVMAVAFNVVLYFLSNLRREPSQFFIFFLISYLIMFVMSAAFRTLAAITKTVSQAMTLAGVLALALIVYSGFLIPVPSMHPWFGWIHYLNPIFYAFEIFVANEFHGRGFKCSGFTPNYNDLTGNHFVCSVTGAIAGHRTVSGDDYIWKSFQYSYSHVWRNFGILLAFLIGLLAIYFMATELNSSTTSAAEVLVFLRGHEPAYLRGSREGSPGDEESGQSRVTGSATDVRADKESLVASQDPDIFNWKDVVYDIEIKGEPRRLLDHVSGWVKPGTLTALMGVSGAGKTTLLDVLAQRTTMGVVTGSMFVNDTPLNASFERNTGYVQQQDLHLETATVRESLRFSAMLRQPSTVPTEEKYQHVEEVIDLLNMQDFAEAIVGVPGEGLNVEQRKLLSIGVELAAKPRLLLFLDEPTSGLDSQSSWAICTMLRKLADSGQAILCTIHQPSAILFQEFDQLLFLARGGKTVYFGPIGANSRTLLDYFETHGARRCEDEENPAEYMLDVVNSGTNGKGESWFDVWNATTECAVVQSEIHRIHEQMKGKLIDGEESDGNREFAVSLSTQLWVVTYRVFQQYWRMPDYIIAKMMLGISSGLFIGFSFYKSENTLQGTQNVMFSLFMVCAIFSSLVQQIMPLFVTQRSLYEVRERPSKTYSWKAFILANIVVEIPYQIMVGILVFICYYYAVNGTQEASARQGLVLLFCIEFFVYAGTFATMVIAALPDAETAGAVVTLLFAMSLLFNGVMQSPTALPGFWIFMYRLSPFTYWIGGMTSTQLHGRAIRCSSAEMSVFDPPSGQTCGQYLAEFLLTQVGKLENPDAESSCRYCSVSTADEYLSGSGIFWDQRWRNFGLVWVYVVFDIILAVGLYYVFRVMKWNPSTFKRKIAKK